MTVSKMADGTTVVTGIRERCKAGVDDPAEFLRSYGASLHSGIRAWLKRRVEAGLDAAKAKELRAAKQKGKKSGTSPSA
jgi:hypothetical protein